MWNYFRSIPKAKYYDYFILIARVLLGWTFLRYGFSKISGGQFGLSEAELMTSVEDLSLFKLSWYVFDQEPFKAFVGWSQLLCGALLILNRTVLLGALMFLPIVLNILIIDLTIMPPGLALSFGFRLSFYLLLDLLILWHYKDRMLAVWRALGHNVSTRYRFRWWTYILLPLLAIGLEVVGVVPKMLTLLVMNPEGTLVSWLTIPEALKGIW